jgi:hypothetical protein
MNRKSIFLRGGLGVTAVAAAAAVSCWRAPGPTAAAARPAAAAAQLEAEAAETTPWLEVASGNGAFSLRIPDGWRVYRAQDRDWVAAVSVDDMESQPGTLATIDRDTTPLGDGDFRFSVYTSGNPYRPARLARVARKGFGPVDGVLGMRYTEDYPEAGAGSTAWYAPGERDYYYVFFAHGLYYYAVYRVLPGEPNRILTVEKCVGTLKFFRDGAEKE